MLGSLCVKAILLCTGTDLDMERDSGWNECCYTRVEWLGVMKLSTIYLALITSITFVAAGTCFLILSKRIKEGKLAISVKDPARVIRVRKRLRPRLVVHVLLVINLVFGILSLANIMLSQPQDLWGRILLIPLPLLSLSIFLFGLGRFETAYVSALQNSLTPSQNQMIREAA